MPTLNLSHEWLRDIVDITVVAFLVYRALLLIKGTRAAQMLLGLGIIVILYFIAQKFGLVTLSWLLGNFLSSIILVVVVLFQDEIRRALTKVGRHRFLKKQTQLVTNRLVEDVTVVCDRLSSAKIGALIVIQREVGLEEIMEDSVFLDARLNRKLLFALFLKDSPLHDGAVILDGDRIKAAGCVLPLSFNPDLDPNLGTRHRAAVGVTERSDSLAVVVSEENGSISLAREGKIIQNLDPTLLSETLNELLSGHKITGEKIESTPHE